MTLKDKVEHQGEATDLAALWSRAIRDYEKRTGVNTRHMEAHSIMDVKDGAESSLQRFQDSRHKGDGVDKIRTAFGNQLDGIQKCWRGIEMVANAAGAFPPAMPVGVLFAACGRVLGAFAAVKADFDKIEGFFYQSSRFLERLSIIEGKVRDLGPLEKGIVEVFSAQLSICAIAEYWTRKEGKRFKKWFTALWTMEDPDLASAFGLMQTTLDELDKLVGFASYAAIKDTQDATAELSVKTDEINENIRKFRAEQGRLGKDMRMMYEKQVGLEVQIVAGFAMFEEEREHQTEHRAEVISLLKEIRRDRNRPDHQAKDKSKQTTIGNGKSDAGDQKFKAMMAIRTHFTNSADVFPNWRDAYKENTAQHQEMKESFIDHTGTWIANDPAFQKWTEGEAPLLWIKGPEGIGKSFLAHSSSRSLQPQDDGSKFVAYFYFKEDFPYLQSVQNAFACAVLQVAELNARYALQTANYLKDNGENAKDVPTWRQFFLTSFSSEGTSEIPQHLYLIFDGVDDISKRERQVLLEFLADLKKEKSNVRVLITSRSSEDFSIDQLEPLTIEATITTMMRDIRLLIWHRVNTSPRLKKFSFVAKKKIRREVARKADGMLYAEHTMKRLAYIGREGAVVKSLEQMPDSLHDLYRLMLEDCRRNRSQDQYVALKKLFAWLAFSKRSLSLAEASELVKLIVTDDHFDLEDEIIGRSSRILELSRTRRLDDDPKDESKDDENEDQDDEQEEELDEYQNEPLTFQERSLRQYCRAISVEYRGEEELRSPASSAHLSILGTCVDVLMKSAKMLKEKTPSKLRSYALSYWHEHFSDLDPDSASDADVSLVLSLLYQIMSNENNVAKLFERFTYPSDIYTVSEEGAAKPWYDKIQLWAVRGTSESIQALRPEVKAWAAHVTANPKDTLVPLARGHKQSWLTEPVDWAAEEAYRFTEEVLKLGGRFEKYEDDPLKQILSIADTFEDHTTIPTSLRAIGTRLYWAATELDNEDRSKELKAKAIVYLSESIGNMEGDKLEKGATLFTLTRMHMWMEDYEKAGVTVDNAIQNFINAKSELLPARLVELEDISSLWELYVYKANCSAKLQGIDAALAMFGKAREEAGDQTISGYYLDDITRILDEKNDPDGHRLMEALKSWSDKERTLWFEWCTDYVADLSALGRMHRAVQLTQETDLMLKWLHTYEATLNPRSLALFNLKASLADFYSKVLGNLDKAKEIMRAILSSQPKTDNEWALHYTVSAVRMDLAGLIFSQFRYSSDPAQKEALLKEVKSLPGTRSDDEFAESHIGMLIANMVRIMGPAREYHRYMDQIFKICINGLEDGVSSNDGDSLRLLAKVLGSLDGLERDARITLSMQFCIINREIHHGGDSSKLPSENGELEGKQQMTKEARDETGKEGAVASLEESTIPSADKKGTGKIDEDPKPKSESESESESEEDLSGFGIFCNGGCGTSISKWSQPFYLCLICPSTDLCEACHAKRIAANSSEISNLDSTSSESLATSLPFCGENHHYIKGPMKNWKGIKNGVIRIGGEEIKVKEWIRGLKEERWPRAWKRYWLRQSGLKDIDVED
ncbi:hypothetical protein CC78DRAFT_567200 [Lojkania enalia]|uniref:NACHT domain-containing protein n=1 Tax=Lojkania enalia TaxID=147567 RepID=A0A9P4KC00_9PLEO|nr:hypothetical protein CC78DRAFT_567200 [Didymosphaeria enalia]